MKKRKTMHTPSLVSQTHNDAELTASEWPIAAGMLPFPPKTRNGGLVQLLGRDEWFTSFEEVATAGFASVEITDTWLRAGDLDPNALTDLNQAAHQAGLNIPAVALIRRSVIDPHRGMENLAYSHRSIEAAAQLGAKIVSVGLHEALKPAQKKALWFWTEPGATNPDNDRTLWKTAVHRLRELGQHARELGLLLSLEMYEDTFLGTADSAVHLIEDINLPEVGLNPDTGNLIRLHRPIENWDEVLAKTLPYTNYWHVKNYLRDEDPTTRSYSTVPIPMELGLINYRKAIKDAIHVGFRGVITCEHYGGDGLGVSALNHRYLRTLLPTSLRPDVTTNSLKAHA